jgi:hypothetical protein
MVKPIYYTLVTNPNAVPSMKGLTTKGMDGHKEEA